MLQTAVVPRADTDRKIVHASRGNTHGPVTCLTSPGDLGELIKPFVFLDLFDMQTFHKDAFGFHTHSGITTITTIFQGDTNYEGTTGKIGLLKAGASDG